MEPKAVRVCLEVPEEVRDQSRMIAERKAREAAILALWQEAELSTRQAADELDLHYQDFMDLLAARGIPVERGEPNLEAIAEASRKLASRRQ